MTRGQLLQRRDELAARILAKREDWSAATAPEQRQALDTDLRALYQEDDVIARRIGNGARAELRGSGSLDALLAEREAILDSMDSYAALIEGSQGQRHTELRAKYDALKDDIAAVDAEITPLAVAERQDAWLWRALIASPAGRRAVRSVLRPGYTIPGL